MAVYDIDTGKNMINIGLNQKSLACDIAPWPPSDDGAGEYIIAILCKGDGSIIHEEHIRWYRWNKKAAGGGLQYLGLNWLRKKKAAGGGLQYLGVTRPTEARNNITLSPLCKGYLGLYEMRAKLGFATIFGKGYDTIKKSHVDTGGNKIALKHIATVKPSHGLCSVRYGATIEQTCRGEVLAKTARNISSNKLIIAQDLLNFK